MRRWVPWMVAALVLPTVIGVAFVFLTTPAPEAKGTSSCQAASISSNASVMEMQRERLARCVDSLRSQLRE